MAEQKLKLKKKLMGFEPRTYLSIIKRTCEKLRNIVNAVNSSMWQMGKILSEALKELGIERTQKETWEIHQFYEDVRKNLDVEVTTNFLGECVKFYERYPDLQNRVEKTGLTATHYERLSHLPEKEAKKYEQKAVEMKWNVRELREKAFPQRLEIKISDVVERYNEFVDALTGFESAMEELRKSGVKGLTQNQIDGMARSVYVLILSSMPKFVKFLMKNDAKVDPQFKAYVDKFVK
jgi:hypothetical protein